MTQTVTMQSRHTPYPKGGVNKSETQQVLADAVVEDLTTLAEATNNTSSELQNLGATIIEEVAHVKGSIKSLKSKQDFRERNSTVLVHTMDMFNKADFSYAENSSPNNRLVLDQRNGQIYLPPTSSSPLFFNEDPDTGDIIVNSNLDARVVSISEGVSGNYQPVITAGNIKNAFNGYNASYWVRKVEYPVEAPITEVVVEVEITVPAGAPSEFNVFSIAPHPIGRVDIEGVWYKERADSGTWTILEEFPKTILSGETEYSPVSINEATNQQWIGQIRPVHSFKVRMRQRDWTIENNKKVFTYGAQEIAAKLDRYANVTSISPFSTENNAHIIYKVTSPETTVFGAITKIDIGPNPKTEGTNIEDNHIIYQFSKVPNPQNSTDILWTSHTSSLPQNGTAVALDDITEYYIIINMKYINQISKDLSIFKNGATPVMDSLNIIHSISSTEDLGEEDNAIDWTPRNASTHFQNLMLMDSYRGAVEDGANMFLFWDDMWEDGDWRTSLESSISNLVVNASQMSLTVEADIQLFSGQIDYIPLTSAEWGGGMLPRSFRLQTAISNVDGSNVSFLINYELNNSPQTPITISHTDLVNSRGSIDWQEFPFSDPSGVGYIGDVTSMSVTAVLTNGTSAGARPHLYQFALIVKD